MVRLLFQYVSMKLQRLSLWIRPFYCVMKLLRAEIEFLGTSLLMFSIRCGIMGYNILLGERELPHG